MPVTPVASEYPRKHGRTGFTIYCFDCREKRTLTTKEWVRKNYKKHLAIMRRNRAINREWYALYAKKYSAKILLHKKKEQP